MLRARNQTKNSVLAEKVEQASKFCERLKGLLGRKNLAPEEGLWIHPCNSIHTFFMRFSIDAIFLSQNGSVVRMYEDLRPFRLTPVISGAHGVLELSSGTLKRSSVTLGDQIFFEKTE